MQREGRIQWIDEIKGMAICLMVLGHVIQYGNGKEFLASGAFWENKIFLFIYSFHMPLFMFLSGFCFWNTCNKYTANQIVQKKIKSLLIPIVAWNIVMFFVRGVKYHWDVSAYWKDNYNFLWFLWSLFYCSLVTIVVHKVAKDSKIVFIIIIFSGFFYPDIANSVSFKMMYPFFILGYLTNKDQWLRILTNNSKQWKIAIIINVIVYICLANVHFISYWQMSGLYINNIVSVLGRWSVNLAGIITINILWIHCKSFSKLQYLLKSIGKETMGIYIISVYACNYILPNFYFDWQKSRIFNSLYSVFLCVIIIIISYVFVVLVNKFEIVKKVFLGK